MVPEINKRSYEYRSEAAQLSTLMERRRIRGDMITIFRSQRGRDDVNMDQFFEIQMDQNQRTYWEPWQDTCQLGRTEIFFSTRAVDTWDELRKDEVINCELRWKS